MVRFSRTTYSFIFGLILGMSSYPALSSPDELPASGKSLNSGDKAGKLSVSMNDENCSYSSASVRGDTIDIYPSNSLWFGFRLEGAAGRVVRINIKGIRTVRLNKGGQNESHWFERNRPGITYDHKEWEVPETGYTVPSESNTGSYSFTHKFTKSPAWIYYAYTVTNGMLESWLSDIGNNRFLSKKILCKTPGLPGGGQNGKCTPRPLWQLTITDPQTDDAGKKLLWIHAREDAWETAGTVAAMGMVEFLLSDNPVAVSARKKGIWKIIPIVSVDAVAGGYQSGLDHNGKDYYITNSWGDTTINNSSIVAMEREIKSIYDSGKHLDFAMYMHSFMWFYWKTFPYIKTPDDLNLGNAIVTRMKAIKPDCVVDSPGMDPYVTNAPHFFSEWLYYTLNLKNLPIIYVEYSMMDGRNTTQPFNALKKMGEATILGISDYFKMNDE